MDADLDGETGEGAGQAPLRDGLGRFLPGNTVRRDTIGQAVAGKRGLQRALTSAVEAAVSPEELTLMIEQVVSWALHYRSPKVLLEVIKLRLAYGIGLPVQRSISASGKLEDIMAKLEDMSEEEYQVLLVQARQIEQR